jgi:hypothetical protein
MLGLSGVLAASQAGARFSLFANVLSGSIGYGVSLPGSSLSPPDYKGSPVIALLYTNSAQSFVLTLGGVLPNADATWSLLTMSGVFVTGTGVRAIFRSNCTYSNPGGINSSWNQLIGAGDDMIVGNTYLVEIM